jgi:hypothetical protein
MAPSLMEVRSGAISGHEGSLVIFAHYSRSMTNSSCTSED